MSETPGTGAGSRETAERAAPQLPVNPQQHNWNTGRNSTMNRPPTAKPPQLPSSRTAHAQTARTGDGVTGGRHVQPQQQQPSGANPAQSSTPVKPVFRIKRTGFSGPFPFSGQQPPAASSATPSTTPRTTPKINTSAAPGSGPVLSSGSRLGTSHPSPSYQGGTSTPRDSNTSKSTLNERAAIKLPRPQSLSAPTGLNRSHPIEIVESDTDVAPSSASRPQTPSVATIPPGFDDQIYKTWKDEETGHVTATHGALLPPGYKKADNTAFPWICPARSCRRMLPSLAGLGKHFCNSHRAVSFNDNTDGTLSDVGTWTDPTRGDGKSGGGTAKPPIVVSRKPMSLDESPMVESGLHSKAHAQAQTVPRRSFPAKGGPGQIRRISRPASPRDDLGDSEDEITSDFSLRQKLTSLEMANPDRRYDEWPFKDGVLRNAYGCLFPDGYATDTTMPERPWICAIRSCRRLFKLPYELGNHFKNTHKSCLLNDNQDGTLSILTQHSERSSSYAYKAPIIISRNPVAEDPIVEAQRPIYKTPTNPMWVSVWSKESLALSPSIKRPTSNPVKSVVPTVDSRPATVLNPVEKDDRPGFEMASAERRYSDWKDESGNPIRLAGALIPEGYQWDKTFYERPWVCPIRTCRITCRLRRGLDNHFSSLHVGQTLNDNGDGTFSLVGSYNGRKPKVVSKTPLAPDAPPIAETQLPDPLKSIAEGERQKALKAQGHEKRRVEMGSSNPEALWRYISKFVKHSWKHTYPPQHPGIKYLLSLPKVRDLDLTTPLSSGLDTRQIAAIIIQATGKEHDKQCTSCRRLALGPLGACVNNVFNDNEGLRQLLGSYVRSCANCLYVKQGNHCSVKAYISSGMPGVKRTRELSDLRSTSQVSESRRSAVADLDGDDAGPQPMHHGLRHRTHAGFVGGGVGGEVGVAYTATSYNEPTTLRRRSDRLTSTSETASDVLRESRIVTLKLPNGRLKRTSSMSISSDPILAAAHGREKRIRLEHERSSPPPKRDPQEPSLLGPVDRTSEDVEMEDWEKNEGRRNGAPRLGPQPIAYASTNIVSKPSHPNRTVQVAEGVSFLAVSIASGTAHRFERDSTRTRVCSLAGGKVRVQIFDAKPNAGEEFAIGMHGMFRLAPGIGCTVRNRSYVDAVLHVTSVGV